MENALLVGLSRQMALSHELDIIANNIANIDTTGFKADNASFSEFLMPHASDGDFSGSDKHVSFVQDRASWINLAPGAIERTGDPLNVAIDGPGYLVVQTARGPRYTRNGALALNATGQIVTSDGNPVLGGSGPITLQQPTTTSPSAQAASSRCAKAPVRPIRRAGSCSSSASISRPAAKRRRLDAHGAERRYRESSTGKHARRPGRDRKIQRQWRRRDGAHDRDHAQLQRYRRTPATAGRSAPQRAATALADAGELIRLRRT
jgi:flagellar hook-basal body protein